jgi:predicted RNA methylase
MARLMAQARGCYYAAPPEAVAFAASMLRPPNDEPFCLLDACAGEGLAIKQLAHALGCKPEHVYAIELDSGRAEKVKTNLPGSNVVAPSSFLTTAATAGSWSLIWLNPPFDSTCGGGGRVEAEFLRRATTWLRPQGVLQLICPERVATGHEITELLLQWFDKVSLHPFPDGHRHYDEVVVTAMKRPKPRSSKGLYWHEECKRELQVYELPPAPGPKRFEKIAFTDDELLEAIRRSPLRRHLETPKDLPIVEPPLPLATGHIALLLASGKLDGPVYPPGEAPHIVRGTASKVKYQSDQTVDETKDGGTKTTTVYSEKISLSIRAVDASGDIRTFAE